jgi:AcrR family transcriptional regulator
VSRAAPLSAPDRRASLLTAARQVFAQRGYHSASVSDILEVAGVARGTFYNHFESKRDVFAAVLAELMGEIGSVVAPIDVTRAIPAQVHANLRAVLRAMADAGDANRILFTDALSVDREGEEALAAFYAAALDRVERALRAGQALGVVRPGETQQTARCLLGLLKEPVMQSNLARQPLDAEAVADAIFALITGGVLRAEG